MSSLSRVLAGRKRDSPVWDYFVFSHETDKSKCNECGSLLSGKNSTNLVAHLSRMHKDLYEQYKAKLVDHKKKEGCKSDGGGSSSPSAKLQTLHDCLIRKSTVYPRSSFEHMQRLKSVTDFLVDSAYPVALLDKPSFRCMFSTMDPKFNLPS